MRHIGRDNSEEIKKKNSKECKKQRRVHLPLKKQKKKRIGHSSLLQREGCFCLFAERFGQKMQRMLFFDQSANTI